MNSDTPSPTSLTNIIEILPGRGIIGVHKIFHKNSMGENARAANSKRKETQVIFLARDMLPGFDPQTYQTLLKHFMRVMVSTISRHKNKFRGDDYKRKKVKIVVPAHNKPS